MKSRLFCFLLLAALPLNTIGQDAKPDRPPHLAAALKKARSYQSKVEELKQEYYAQLAKMDAEYKANVKDLRAALIKDLVELQSQTAKEDLDDAALILDMARQFEKFPNPSPYEADVAADNRVAVFLQRRPKSDIVERIHILAANGRSLVVNADYQAKVQSGEWQFDGNFITYTEQYAPRTFDEKSEEISIPIRYDAVRKEYSFPEMIDKNLKYGAYVNGSGQLLLGNPAFLIPAQDSDDGEKPSDESNPE